MNSGNRSQLPLASSGCSCCTPATAQPSKSLPATTQHEAPAAVEHADAATPRNFAVQGMTCGHCVRSVETAVSALPGVSSASVQLVPGGRSRLTVAGTASDADVSQAVTAAGYALA